ncbi:ABC transporter permease [Allorhizocola rhizosphaerae]|uniref:ABC transporter permease n=1 Tax=Allorhizocola rhizosphaerae TaxID=1872709 RepID=UPI000E3CA63A|nr:ABC transporter permease [Allorhizocola rhizosphaerae]
MIRLKGRLRSALIIGLQGIRARKLRTLLSIMSLFLGVLAVVVVQAASETARRAALGETELTMGKDGTLQMYVPTEGKALETALDTVKDRPDVVATTDMSAIIGEPKVTPINRGGMPFAAVAEGQGGPRLTRPDGGEFICGPRGCYPIGQKESSLPETPGQAIELRLSAMTGDVRQFKPFRQQSGQWLDFASAASLAPRIVLNKEAAKFFGTYAVPAEMRISGATANMTPQILGVVDDGIGEPRAYVRMDELQNWLPAEQLRQGGTGLQLLMEPHATDVMQILKTRLAASGLEFAQQLRAEPVDSRERVADQLALIRWVFLGMAGLVLLIGVAGILNVGLATVGERVEEFALRRAVGTSRSLLAGIVLAETLLTGLLTAGAAIGTGMLALNYVGRYLGKVHPVLATTEFPWQAGVAGVVAGLIAGLLGGLIPALRAARIPIATVMRA